MSAQIPPSDPNGSDSGEEGKGSGSFGSPKLKPNLDKLFDPASAIAEDSQGEEGSGSSGGSGLPERVTVFGEWEHRESSLMLYHRTMRKRLMLEQLNHPSKMMKVIVALATQSGWDSENLVRAMDDAAQKHFGRNLYALIAMVHDSSSLDWKKGVVAPEPARRDGPASSF